MYQLKTFAFVSVVILALTFGVKANSCCTHSTCVKADDSVDPMNDDSVNPMNKVLSAYFGIRAELAEDSTRNIAKFSKTIQEQVELLKKGDINLSPDQTNKLLAIVSEIAESAAKLKGKIIRSDRENFKSLSKSVIEYVKEFQRGSEDADKPYIFHCSMAKASWVQDTKDIGNPYYGSSMLKCGKLVKD